MFDKIQHIGYLVRDLDAAVAWYAQGFGAENAGGSNLPAGGIIPSGGRNAFVHFGKVEVELIEPQDKTGLPDDSLVMHHVGYAVSDIAASVLRRFVPDISDFENAIVKGNLVLQARSSL